MDRQNLSKSARKRLVRRMRNQANINNISTNRSGSHVLGFSPALKIGSQSTNGSMGRSVKKRRNRRRNKNGLGMSIGSAPGDLYISSLLNPDIAGSKIPDLDGFPSGTFQLSYDGILGTQAGGDSLGLFFQPVIGSGTGPYPITVTSGTSMGSLLSSANVNWTSRGTVANLFGSFRPTSAYVQMEFIGPTTSDGGYMIGSLLPPTTANSTSVAAAITLPNSVSVPLRNGLRTCWRPADNSDFEYQPSNSVYYYPCVQIVVTGMPSSTSYIKARVVCNFEALASADTIDIIDAQPSPIDLSSLQKAMSVVQSVSSSVALFGYAGPYVSPAVNAVATMGRQFLRGGASRVLNPNALGW